MALVASLLIVAALSAGVLAGLVIARRLRFGAGENGSAARLWQVIAVPMIENRLPEAALATAARLAKASGSHVTVLAVVPIPRTMSLNAEEAPGLEEALGCVDAAERFVRGRGAAVHGELVRVREVGELVQRACAEAGAQAVVVEVNSGSRPSQELLREFVERQGPHAFDIVVAHAEDYTGA